MTLYTNSIQESEDIPSRYPETQSELPVEIQQAQQATFKKIKILVESYYPDFEEQIRRGSDENREFYYLTDSFAKANAIVSVYTDEVLQTRNVSQKLESVHKEMLESLEKIKKHYPNIFS